MTGRSAISDLSCRCTACVKRLERGATPELRLLEATQSELPLQSHDRPFGGL